MKLEWSPTARHDLRQVEAFIADDIPRAAAELAVRIIRATERLTTFPDSGRPGRLPHTRELVISGTPFILPYRVRNDVVEILAVLHGARRWPEV